ncbi:hypothetical protein PCANC_21472 [Puccinia coronata f. sp. avenae]|uniref:Uncharacterized protein n=1 Tax=Puccinia coronata f. sp. avenae TaxID=200324 RepID=A0A2N5U087_9BASI|nr:hypothetical protein PCANC_21472 [Puccinia coronata f. sp. avenae]
MGCILERHIFRAEFLVIPPSLINSLAFSAWYPARWLNRSEHTLQFPSCNLIRPRSQPPWVLAALVSVSSLGTLAMQHDPMCQDQTALDIEHGFDVIPCKRSDCDGSVLLKTVKTKCLEYLRQALSVSDVQTTWSSRSGLSPARLGNTLRSDLR